MGLSGPGNLPVHLTRFFDREPDLAALEGTFDRVRIVTLTGAPGCGKSRLGIELGRRVAERFADGVWLVELASISEPARVAGAVAFVLDIGERAGQSAVDSLVDALADRELLLILDDCEHVAEEVAAVVTRLAESCPAIRVLATSRLPLAVPGEQVWAVTPLAMDPAVELFVDRGRLVSSVFQADDAERDEIRRICDRLDGVPLAIELAAAWTRVLSPAQIVEHLDGAWAMRPAGVRSAAARCASPRQETMDATVEWSYRLLGPAERRLFAQLSVFPGGFDLAAVEAIAGPGHDVLAELTTLVDHSLVQADSAPAGVMRYQVLAPLRRYGAASLTSPDEIATLRQRHAEHYLAVARRGDACLRWEGTTATLRAMELDERNFTAALEWARTAGTDLALRLCAALARFWELRKPVGECIRLMEEALEIPTDDLLLRGQVLARAGRLAWRQQDYAKARDLLTESVAIAQRYDDQLALAHRLLALALVAISEDDGARAEELCREGMTTFRAAGDDSGLALTLVELGWSRFVAGDVGGACELMAKALAVSERCGYGPAIALSLQGLAYGAQVCGDVAAAREHLVAAHAVVSRAGLVASEPGWLWCCAVLAADERRFESAVRLVGGAEARGKRRGSAFSELLLRPLRARLDGAVRAVGSAADALLAEGSRMTWDDLMAEALAEPEAASIPLTRREREVARLVAEGLTNAEIAERLFISKRTVESHVEHIKQKLGHSSRSQLIAWAVREPLA